MTGEEALQRLVALKRKYAARFDEARMRDDRIKRLVAELSEAGVTWEGWRHERTPNLPDLGAHMRRQFRLEADLLVWEFCVGEAPEWLVDELKKEGLL